MTLIPFKQMKATVAGLQAAIFLVVGTLKADALDKTQVQTVYSVIVARDMSEPLLKNNPTRKQMMTLCGAWLRLAEQMQPLIPADQAEMAERFQNVLKEAAWVKAFDQPAPVSEVAP